MNLLPLGTDALDSVSTFLSMAATPQSGADLQGQRLASQLLLAVSMQRGLLHHLLAWVQLALAVSATAQSESKKSGGCGSQESNLGRIDNTFFRAVLAQMIDKTVFAGLCLVVMMSFFFAIVGFIITTSRLLYSFTFYL